MMKFPEFASLVTILAVFYFNGIFAQYQLHDADTSVLIGATDTCLNTYNGNVSCTSTIGYLYSNKFPDLTADDLSALCTSDCFDSLVSHRNSVSTACSNTTQYYDDANGAYWPSTYLDEQAIYGYNLTCVKRSDGSYCNTWFQSSRNDSSTSECDDCYLKSLFIQAESPAETDADEIRSAYVSMSSSCSYSGPTATTASSLMISSPTPSRTCSSMYTVQAGDTYYSVSQSQQVSTNGLINLNGLTYNVSDFPTSGTLCIQNQCSVYVVQQNDTCDGIIASTNVTYAQLTSWNPPINGLCSNLGDMINQTLCLSNPTGEFTVKNNTHSASYTTPAPVPSSVGPNTTTNCGLFYTVASGDNCASVSLKFNIALKDFYFLNPEINANCTNLDLDVSYCVAPVGTITTYPGYGPTSTTFSITPASSTPVPFVDLTSSNSTNQVIVPIANETRTDCWDYIWINDTVGSDFSCWDVASFSDLSSEEFVLWNPSLDQNSDNATARSYDYSCTLSPSYSYCNVLASPTVATTVATSVPPSPRAAGEISNCTAWLQVTDGVDCSSILSSLRIDPAVFYQMNPSTKSDCSGLSAGTYYCYSCNVNQFPGIGDLDSSPTSSSTSSAPASTGTGVVFPTPTQSGIAQNCNDFHKVVQNDTCYDIAAAANISLDNFYAWNPAVNTDCSGLDYGYYVCIGVSSASSTSTVSTSSTTSSSQPTSTSTTSPDGTCGGASGYNCAGSGFGDCCSQYGSCGSTSDFCAVGCQTAFGNCKISTDGSCGGSDGMSCAGSGFGDCCSQYGSCGSTSEFCAVGCQSAFGNCKVSTDGTCGGDAGYACPSGNCCSQYGSCGTTSDFCAVGCQPTFGDCKVSTDGTCGGDAGYACTSGNCCSQYGSCGSSSDFCGAGCQSTFGECD